MTLKELTDIKNEKFDNENTYCGYVKNENWGSVETNSAHSDIVATANMTPVPPPNAPNRSERTNIKPATAPPWYNNAVVL